MIRHFFALCLCLQILVPVWAEPDILFTGRTEEGADIYRYSLSDKKVLPVAAGPGNQLHPAVSPDGTRLAFVSDHLGASSLYIANLLLPKQEWTDVSAGMGAYAHPAFSPDGRYIAVSYAPDPEEPLRATSIVLVDFQKRTQQTVLRANKVQGVESDGPILVVDRPCWVDQKHLVIVEVEYGDLASGRITKSTIFRLDLDTGALTRLAGGESYYDVRGRAKGYMATMPSLVSVDNLPQLCYVAVEGRFERTPMTMPQDGGEKKVLKASLPEFFGPLLCFSDLWVYGSLNEEGTRQLTVRTKKAKPVFTKVPFAGSAFDPLFVPTQ